MMDNNAFRELFAQGRKTTKEIAREAVEEEARRNKRKRGGRNRNHDDDSSDEDDKEKKNNINQHKTNKIRQRPVKKDNATIDTGKYRDRAQERRAGKAIDYEGVQQHLEVEVDADMTKYLGGDEEHTHLVKGLDVVLSRKVKREIMQNKRATTTIMSDGGDEDLDSILERAKEEKTTSMPHKVMLLRSRPLDEWSPTDVHSTLGRDVLMALQAKAQSQSSSRLDVGSAGLALQRASLTFSCLNSHPGNIARAWEIPVVDTKSMVQYTSRDERGWFSDATLLARVQTSFRNRTRSMEQQSPPNETQSDVRQQAQESNESDDGDDDDIFADAGDYIPEMALKQTCSSLTKPASLFSGLLPASQQQGVEAPSEDTSSAMDIVAKLARKATQQQHTEKMNGGLSNFDGDGYGYDDMDADFAGQMEEDDGDETKSHKKKKKLNAGEDTTVASFEYGRGKKRGNAAVSDG